MEARKNENLNVEQQGTAPDLRMRGVRAEYNAEFEDARNWYIQAAEAGDPACWYEAASVVYIGSLEVEGMDANACMNYYLLRGAVGGDRWAGSSAVAFWILSRGVSIWTAQRSNLTGKPLPMFRKRSSWSGNFQIGHRRPCRHMPRRTMASPSIIWGWTMHRPTVSQQRRRGSPAESRPKTC